MPTPSQLAGWNLPDLMHRVTLTWKGSGTNSRQSGGTAEGQQAEEGLTEQLRCSLCQKEFLKLQKNIKISCIHV